MERKLHFHSPYLQCFYLTMNLQLLLTVVLLTTDSIYIQLYCKHLGCRRCVHLTVHVTAETDLSFKLSLFEG